MGYLMMILLQIYYWFSSWKNWNRPAFSEVSGTFYSQCKL